MKWMGVVAEAKSAVVSTSAAEQVVRTLVEEGKRSGGDEVSYSGPSLATLAVRVWIVGTEVKAAVPLKTAVGTAAGEGHSVAMSRVGRLDN